MARKLQGLQTIAFDLSPKIVGSATIAGPKEKKGNLAPYIDNLVPDPMLGEQTRKAERKLLYQTCQEALARAKLTEHDMDFLRRSTEPDHFFEFLCQRLGYSLHRHLWCLFQHSRRARSGAMLVDGEYADQVLIATSSHYQASERQFRYPIELNIQHKGTSQWTVTGAGAAVLSTQGEGPRITCVTFGRAQIMALRAQI